MMHRENLPPCKKNVPSLSPCSVNVLLASLASEKYSESVQTKEKKKKICLKIKELYYIFSYHVVEFAKCAQTTL